MPSSADEAFGQIDNIQRKDSIRQAIGKKQKKRNKHLEPATSPANIPHKDESNPETAYSVDLLNAPFQPEDCRLSSSPDTGISSPEPPCPNTPPIYAQEPLVQTLDNGSKRLQSSIVPLVQTSDDGPSVRDSDALLLDPSIGVAHISEYPPMPTISPSMHQSTPSQTPRLASVSPRLSCSRPDPRAMNPLPRRPSWTDPDPPHMPQRHFSRVPRFDLGIAGTTDGELTAGTDEYYCGFDTLEHTAMDSPDVASNIILIGSEGALDLCRYNRHRKEVVGRLEGLRGRVVDAKILPLPSGQDVFAQYRPLIACVLYGSTPSEAEDTQHNAAVDSSSGPSRTFSAYRITVEVLSLKKSKHLSTLFKSALQPLPYPVGHPSFVEPPMQGTISIAVSGRHIVVASGESGEIVVFAPFKDFLADAEPTFRCIGKYWTRIRPVDLTSSTEGAPPIHETHEEKPRVLPMFSMSRRWLAIAPPLYSSSQKSIDGQATTLSHLARPPGIDAYVSPPPPTIDCEVDAPSGPSLLNRVTKQATKEIRKGAQWMGEQGMSMIKGYWNRSPSGSSIHSPTQGRRSPADDPCLGFPPTHGHAREHSTVRIDPSLISIIDLQKLQQFEEGGIKSPLSPLATFNLVDGCSFLSFAPSGLSLLTTNQVGDASTVWDLTRVTDARAASRLTQTTPQVSHASGLVRKVASFNRVSPSSVVDVRWTSASNRVGILTHKGTLHLYDLPRSDTLPLAIRPTTSTGYELPSDRSSPSTSPLDGSAGWISNVRSGLTNVSGRLSSIASASENGSSMVSSTRQSINQASVAARYASGRAMRNGYNSAIEGAYSLRHAQDNKIRLKSLFHAVKPSCFRWLTGKDEGLISTVADGSLCTYTVRSNYHVQGKRTIVVLDASRKAGPPQTLPSIGASKLPPSVLGQLDPDGPHASCARAGVHGFWTLNRDAPATRDLPKIMPADIEQDKETCPQYLPLHRLRQVSLHTYSDDSDAVQKQLGLGRQEAWCFGGVLAKVDKVCARPKGGDERVYEDVVGAMEDFVVDEGRAGDALAD